MSIHEKLNKIQCELKAPKNLYNSFGKYSYRNAEGICEAVKPFLKELKCTLIICDNIVLIGERYYVEASATLTDCETGEKICTHAYAREDEKKTGMTDSQNTGSCSSYARKYCLNAMFLLDDTKDADTDEYRTESNAKAQKPVAKETKAENVDDMKIPEVKVKALKDKLEADKIDVVAFLKLYKVKNLSELTEKQFRNAIDNWEKVKEKLAK